MERERGVREIQEPEGEKTSREVRFQDVRLEGEEPEMRFDFGE